MEISTRKTILLIDPFPEALTDRYSSIRLDFNENTDSLKEMSLDNLDMVQLSAYPQYGKLMNRLSALYGVDSTQLMLSTGSDEALPSIANTLIEPGIDCAIIAKPTFSVIRQGLVLAEARLVEVPVLPDMTFNEAAFNAALEEHKPKLVMVATPDNPTGSVIPVDRIARWTQRYPETVFLIDEAYYEYARQTTMKLLETRTNLLITRTFSKAWGLAGLRVGVTIGNTALISALKRSRLPFPISSVAAEFVCRACEFQEQVEQMAQNTMMRKKLIVNELKVRGYQLVEGGANFYLLKVGHRAEALFTHLREQNILVRNLSRGSEAPQNPLWGCLRIAVGTDAENESLLSAIETFSRAGLQAKGHCAG